MDQAAVALGGTAGGSGGEVEAGSALLGEFLARCAAGFGFGVELLGDGGGSAQIAERDDVDFEVAALGADGEAIADADLAGGTRGLMIGLDAAQFAGVRSKGAGLEEARGPKPFVETWHDFSPDWVGQHRLGPFSRSALRVRQGNRSARWLFFSPDWVGPG